MISLAQSKMHSHLLHLASCCQHAPGRIAMEMSTMPVCASSIPLSCDLYRLACTYTCYILLHLATSAFASPSCIQFHASQMVNVKTMWSFGRVSASMACCFCWHKRICICAFREGPRCFPCDRTKCQAKSCNGLGDSERVCVSRRSLVTSMDHNGSSHAMAAVLPAISCGNQLAELLDLSSLDLSALDILDLHICAGIVRQVAPHQLFETHCASTKVQL